MSKYIIDTETWANLFEVQRVGVYGIGNDIVTDEKTVWSRMFSLDELEELNSDYINEHYDELQDEAYQAGMDKAWEAAKKIFGHEIDGGLDIDGLKKAFGSDVYCTADIIRTNTAEQAIAKLKAYEDKRSDRIEVGDEVVWYDDATIIVTMTYVDGGSEWCDGVSKRGRVYHVLLENVRKTGKHYDIQSILEAMRK